MMNKQKRVSKLKLLISYFKGELIVLSLHNDELLVDTGKQNEKQVKKAANKLFKTLYNLAS